MEAPEGGRGVNESTIKGTLSRGSLSVRGKNDEESLSTKFTVIHSFVGKVGNGMSIISSAFDALSALNITPVIRKSGALEGKLRDA